MEPLKRFIVALISLILSSILFFHQEVYAINLDGLETKIIAESNTSKIIKLQTFLQKLDLYSGEIDGLHSSVLPSLLSYQKQTGLIVNNSDWGAGYFGVQTLTSISEDYPDKFEEYKYILEQDKPEEGERYFYVTAYYSPLPGQSRYTTGTYAGDIRLNGGGKVTASGKGVFVGLMAGPRNYDFGTKLELDGIGVGSIEDRGGAIVNAGERGFEYDRIDIWMGYGDEGLNRALKWGKRKVKGKVVDSDTPVNIQLNESIVSSYLKLYVTPESNEVDVKKLQTLFTQLDLYEGNIDGKYLSIKDSLIDFQVANSIIESANDSQAGYFGKRTVAVLKEKYKASDAIFIQPIQNDEYDLLTRKDKFTLVKIKNSLNTYYEKKYNGNVIKISYQKSQLQTKLEKAMNSTKNLKKKQKIKYLKVILK